MQIHSSAVNSYLSIVCCPRRSRHSSAVREMSPIISAAVPDGFGPFRREHDDLIRRLMMRASRGRHAMYVEVIQGGAMGPGPAQRNRSRCRWLGVLLS